MKIGLLWHDSSAKALSQKVLAAAKRYGERFGQPANMCYVNPQVLSDSDEREVEGILVRSSPQILMHHLWVGRESVTEEA
jgi:hypothetical protein